MKRSVPVIVWNVILMADTQGVNHNQSNFKFTDNEGINREFAMTKMIFSSAVKWLAEEVNGNYKFEVRADIEDNDEFVISQLQKKIIQGVNTKTLDVSTFSDHELVVLEETGILNIDNDENAYGLPKFIIDGKVFTLEEFGKMLMTYEGYILKYNIIEPSDNY